jgi:hypothetical protein
LFGRAERILAMVARVKPDGPHPCNTVRILSFDEVYCLTKRMRVARVMVPAKQCIPILQFESHQAFNAGNLLLERYHAEMQVIVDNILWNVESKLIVAPDCINDDDLLGL